MYKLTESINKAIQNCKETGRGEVTLLDGNKTVIYAEWENLENDSTYDIITIYIYQAGISQFSYQVEETKIKAED